MKEDDAAQNGHVDAQAQLQDSDTLQVDGESIELQNVEQAKPQKSKDASVIAQDWTNRALDFLSNASNETIGACLVGLGATTYLVLGRVGLILIGAVGGVVVHASWENNISNEGNSGAEDGTSKGRQTGVEIAKRLLDWRERDEASMPDDALTDIHANYDFSDLPSETRIALKDFSSAVLRDYVHYWYDPILPGETSFPASCRTVLNKFLLAVSSRLSKKRHADVFLNFLTNSSSIMIVFLSELSAALAASSTLPPDDAINEYLAANPSSSLSNVLSKTEQHKKLQIVARDVLQNFLDAQSYACDPARTFLQQILASLILEKTVISCSQADFINEWIIYALEEVDTSELGQALDAGVSNATQASAAQSAVLTSSDGVDTRALGTNATEAKKAQTEHRRTVSAAEEAMERAMQEAQIMNDLIAAEEAKRLSQDANRQEIVSVPPTALPQMDTPKSPSLIESVENETPVNPAPATGLKSFSDILPEETTSTRSGSSLSERPQSPPPLTLHNAKIAIFDDSVPGEKGTIRSKPTVDYLLQIEPATTHYPGWMISRKYSDFETLHEVLRRISVISGVAEFTELHQSLPGWKNQTKAKLRVDLEKYLCDALTFQRLAESEAMKRFFEREQHLGRPSPNKPSFGFPGTSAFENVGKGMLDVLSSAPKGAATGGKAIVGGVTGVFGGSLGQKKQGRSDGRETSVPPASGMQKPQLSSRSTTSFSSDGLAGVSRDSLNLNGSSHETLPTTPSPQPVNTDTTIPEETQAVESSTVDTPIMTEPENKASNETLESANELHLPPPPSEISDDYSATQASSRPSDEAATLRTSISTAPAPEQKSRASRIAQPLTVQETSMAVELFFALINELYTLSSAWTLRLTLLNTAKSFLLRPGNANLEAIRQLLQSTVIDANCTDESVAVYIRKLRENSLPTEAELKAWPPLPSEKEKEAKRVKARRLLVEKGMPQALTSVMGAAASGEALGKVFDCLQIERVAKGLVFALTLQAVRAVTQ